MTFTRHSLMQRTWRRISSITIDGAETAGAIWDAWTELAGWMVLLWLLLVTSTQVIAGDLERAKRWGDVRGDGKPLRDHQVAALRDTFAVGVQGDGPESWLVHDLRIGRHSQFSQPGTIPGAEFGADRIDNNILCETAQRERDVTLSVEYIGARKKGAPFYAALTGRVVDGDGALDNLSLSTGELVRRGERRDLTARPGTTFRPHRLMIARTASRSDTAVSLHETLEAALLAVDACLRDDLCSWLGGYLSAEGRFVDTRTRR